MAGEPVIIMQVPIQPIHVLPNNDLWPHECSPWCMCNPVLKDFGTVIVHNSWDGRELGKS